MTELLVLHIGHYITYISRYCAMNCVMITTRMNSVTLAALRSIP